MVFKPEIYSQLYGIFASTFSVTPSMFSLTVPAILDKSTMCTAWVLLGFVSIMLLVCLTKIGGKCAKLATYSTILFNFYFIYRYTLEGGYP